MQTENRFIDDLARVASGAVGVLSGVKEEVEGRLKAQFERILEDMDVVTRDEFEAVKAMAIAAREENERLAQRVAALEAALGIKEETGKRRRAKATTARKPRKTAKAKASAEATAEPAAEPAPGTTPETSAD